MQVEYVLLYRHPAALLSRDGYVMAQLRAALEYLGGLSLEAARQGRIESA